MSVSVFDHPFLSGLLGDAEIGACFSAEEDLKAMLGFEEALADAEAEEGLIPEAAASAIAEAVASFQPDWAKLRDGTARDGVVVPELVRQLRHAVGEPHSEHVHFGATSQDVIDTSLAIRMGRALDILERRIDEVTDALDALNARDGEIEVMAHTRMQAAMPVAASRKILSWRQPLVRHVDRLSEIFWDAEILSLGGAVGTQDLLGDRKDAIRRKVAQDLKVRDPTLARHSERDGVVVLASWLSLLTGCLGKMGQDIVLAAQSEVGEIRIKSGGGSSAMPHKANPVGAEILVTLARFNATLVSGMHQSLVHENERSGAAWTLEWMLLPQMAVAAGAALRTATELVGNIAFVEKGS